jgi:hypothetical protein
VFAVNDGRRRASDLAGDPEVEADAHERPVETHLVDFSSVGDALGRRDQIVARAEGEVVVQILVAVDIDLRRELGIAGRRDEEADVRRPLPVTQQLMTMYRARSLSATAGFRIPPSLAISFRCSSIAASGNRATGMPNYGRTGGGYTRPPPITDVAALPCRANVFDSYWLRSRISC